jgi:SPX domain protein involved in polyphosphate accumulation
MESEGRYELKIVCSARQLSMARNWIRLHPEGFREAYPLRQVNNLYLDTAELEDLNANMNSDNLRRKLRLRWYGAIPLPEMSRRGLPGREYYKQRVSGATLELKRKENMVSTKLRHPLDAEIDLGAPFQAITDTIRAQVPAGWQVLLQRAQRPVLLNHYQREYFVSPDGNVRVTLDYDLDIYDQRFVTRPNLRWPIPSMDKVTIEVKAGLAFQERLQEIMGQFPVARQRHSKYAGGLLQADYYGY